MYNSRQPPKVNHFTGTDLIVEHTEKYVCPSIVSTVFTGKPPFRFKDDKRPFVVFLSAENEYDAAETLPAFAHELQLQHGLRCEIVQGATDVKSKDLHYVSGLEILAQADLAVVFARRRALPVDQMKCLRDYLDRGGPLIGLRTASHAFDTKGTAPRPGYEEWTKFDPEVLGGNYHNHYAAGPKLTVTPVPGATSHPILKGVELPLLSNSSLYRANPLAASATLLLVGTIPDQQPEPVAWTNRYKNSRVFYTSLGSPDDFANPQFRKLLLNAINWATDKK
jgi:type 1 glutamine amidotransferase